jgi:hypothetical protein
MRLVEYSHANAIATEWRALAGNCRLELKASGFLRIAFLGGLRVSR